MSTCGNTHDMQDDMAEFGVTHADALRDTSHAFILPRKVVPDRTAVLEYVRIRQAYLTRLFGENK